MRNGTRFSPFFFFVSESICFIKPGRSFQSRELLSLVLSVLCSGGTPVFLFLRFIFPEHHTMLNCMNRNTVCFHQRSPLAFIPCSSLSLCFLPFPFFSLFFLAPLLGSPQFFRAYGEMHRWLLDYREKRFPFAPFPTFFSL